MTSKHRHTVPSRFVLRPTTIICTGALFAALCMAMLQARSQTVDEPQEPVILNLYNYPNPFDPAATPTHIVYVLSNAATVELSIHDLAGTMVIKRRFASGELGGKSQQNIFDWDGRNDRGVAVAEGIYICGIQTLISEKGTDVHERRFTKIGVTR